MTIDSFDSRRIGYQHLVGTDSHNWSVSSVQSHLYLFQLTVGDEVEFPESGGACEEGAWYTAKLSQILVTDEVEQ